MRHLLEFLLIALLACPAFGEVTHVQTGDLNRKAKASKHAGAASSTPANHLNTPNAQPQLAQESKERADKANLDRKLVEATSDLATFTARLFEATVLLAASTMLLGGLGFLQWRDTQHSLKIAEKSANAALAGATATKDAVEASVGAERAYMFFDWIETARNNVGKPALAPGSVREVVISNLGRTPAILQSYRTLFQYSETPPTADVWDSKPDPGSMRGVSIISGGSLPSAMPRLGASAEQIVRAARGEGAIYSAGRIKYADVFGRDHVTVFCWKFVSDALGFQVVNDPTLNYFT